MALKVTIAERTQSSYLVALEGKLDCDTYSECSETISPLLTESANVLILDMAKLDYLSSLGLRVLNNTRKTIESSKGHMLFINVQPMVRGVFQIVCPSVLDVTFRSLEEAEMYLYFIQKHEAGSQKA